MSNLRPTLPTAPSFRPHPLRNLPRRASPALVLASALLLAACGSAKHDTDNPDWAQSGMPPPPKTTQSDAEWQESAAPPPPAFDQNSLVPIEMPPYMTLKFGIDPKTITITPDGIVRYVVVASSKAGGTVNAFYDGVRCKTGEMKSYARYSGNAWELAKAPEWKRITDLNSRYTWAIATQGLCRDSAPRSTASEIVQYIRNPVREVQ
jgi:hypothetical protein